MPESKKLQPYWTTSNAALYLGDVRACLKALPTRSVHMICTSPPYWGLRRYLPEGHASADAELGLEEIPDCLGWATDKPCGACYVCHLVEVFSEVRRVLRDDGTVWLNLGDTYGSDNNRNGLSSTFQGFDGDRGRKPNNPDLRASASSGLPRGNLVGVPWRVALALQADGWVLRQDIIWYAPNKMPESVRDRCTKSHEHIFLLANGTGYYFDALAIAEPAKYPGDAWHRRTDINKDNGGGCPDGGSRARTGNPTNITVNKRDVWTVTTQGYPGAHFAVFSQRLIEPCILAGTSEHGCCAACGAPWERVVVRTGYEPRESGGSHFGRKEPPDGHEDGMMGQHQDYPGDAVRETVGWRATCGCAAEVVPCTVLDPFVGSGTTVAAALSLGRAGIGIDLSEVYLRENAVPRIEAAMRGEKVGRKATVVVPTDVPPPPKRLRGAAS